MEKKKVIVSYKNLSEDILKDLDDAYPDGFTNHIIKVPKGTDSYFHAVTFETEDTKYLIKVDVVIDNAIDLENDTTPLPDENEIQEIDDPDNLSEEDVE